MGELVLASESYKNAIVLLPNYPDAHNNLGNVFRDLGRLEEAIDAMSGLLHIGLNLQKRTII